MLNNEEIFFNQWLARERYKGIGYVCELGCFLGGSSLSLLNGMNDNCASKYPLLVWDHFVLDGISAEITPHLKPGANFRSEYLKNLGDYCNKVKIHERNWPEGRILSEEDSVYPEGLPIEILYIDIAKSEMIHHSVMRNFFPFLVRGDAWLIQQDFRDCFTYYIPIHMYLLRKYFKLESYVKNGSTAVFRYIDGITRERVVEEAKNTLEFDIRDIDPIWDEIDNFFCDHDNPMYSKFCFYLNRTIHYEKVFHPESMIKSFEDCVGLFPKVAKFEHAYRMLNQVKQRLVRRLSRSKRFAGMEVEVERIMISEVNCG